ncbi:heparinase II/III family protein [Aureimonas populi]|uniref:Heparinase II/III family protein n=1 Tax=Aureimonas populi TaxID=1701758 RepID=A0ABW5CQU6_9HYPH|nr:heparinase II/III family protein [Aureimonas populi]
MTIAAELVDDPRLAGLMAKEAWRRARRRLRTSPSLLWLVHRRASESDRLMAVPRQIERGDRAVAEAIYGGRFELAGHVALMGATTPFRVSEAPEGWQAELASFEWLRHLAEVEDALASANARAHVGDFYALRRRRRAPVAMRPDIIARRLMALFTHAPLVLAQAEPAFTRRFLERLAGEARLLRRMAPEVTDGLPRLQVRIALAYATLCLPGASAMIRTAGANLAAELDRQIFADGGHACRNPDAIALLLKQLLPLRQLYSARNLAVPRGLFSAIDRMLPALRFFLHADGSQAMFNGAGLVSRSLLAGLLRFDETLGDPVGHMRQSGYQRLAQGGAVLIADAGLAPVATMSGEAHAGTLAFEFSSGRQRFVVNCGPSPRDEWRRLARATAAHSTVTVGDRSSSRFPRSERLGRFLGGPLVAGPTRVPATRQDGREGQHLTLAHDGYRAGFGLIHERELLLSPDGMLLEGADRLHKAAGRGVRAGEAEGALRFHLHPDVVAEQAGKGIRLAGGGEVWWFFADAPVSLEDSIVFSCPDAPRPTAQIVARFEPGRAEINWRFERQH